MIKLKGRHFYKIEVIEAKSQAVLNILTEYDFQDALKNGRALLRGRWWPVGIKLISDQMAATVTEIMDRSLHVLIDFRTNKHLL
jgi:hypothetical protein